MKDNKEDVVVAVYGSLLAGERNAHWAGDARREEAITKGRLFDTGYGFPAFCPDEECGDPISVELIHTDAAGLAHMDVLEGYPRLYRRERIKAQRKDERGVYQTVEAWVYVMNNLPEGAKRIECGDWRVYRKGKEASR